MVSSPSELVSTARNRVRHCEEFPAPAGNDEAISIAHLGGPSLMVGMMLCQVLVTRQRECDLTWKD